MAQPSDSQNASEGRRASGHIVAFSLDQVSRMTGLSEKRLRYWDRTRLFSPQFAAENRRSPFSRVYSYRDVVGLRTLALLRIKYRVSLQALREVDAWLRQHYDTPWSELTFWVSGKDVFFDDPSTGARIAGNPAGQTAIPIVMDRVAREADEAIRMLRERRPQDVGRISRNRHIQSNAWVIAGTRIPTWSVWDLHEAGYDVGAIRRQYPSLEPADIQAAIKHEEEQRA